MERGQIISNARNRFKVLAEHILSGIVGAVQRVKSRKFPCSVRISYVLPFSSVVMKKPGEILCSCLVFFRGQDAYHRVGARHMGIDMTCG